MKIMTSVIALYIKKFTDKGNKCKLTVVLKRRSEPFRPGAGVKTARYNNTKLLHK